MRQNADKLKVNAPRRGIIIFVVLGAVFVLTILILSYNYLVQGKFNENREILSHIRAMKCAQAVSRYVIEKMKADVKDVNSIEKDSPGNILRTSVFIENDPARLADKMQSAWLEKINFSELTQKLFGDVSIKNVSISPEVSFSDLIFLKDKKKDKELFLDFEKAGNMTVKVEVRIGSTREEWVEVRPFRVIVPYPMPLTKFNLFVRQAADNLDPVKFNTISIESAGTGKVSGGSARPLILHNGMQGKNYNMQSDIWQKRGWIYLGGGNVLLNRAAGNKNFGQRYHSYFPEASLPIALVLQFSNFSSITAGSKKLGFRMARWGFSESLLEGPSKNMWKKILKSHMKSHPPGKNKEKKWWQSTSLHLFGEIGKSVDDTNLSITRVCGNVYDRFLEIGYLSPTTDGEQPVGAVVSLSRTEFDQTTGKQKKGIIKKIKDGASSFITDTWVDKNLVYLPTDIEPRLGVPDLREMESFFEQLPFSSAGGAASYDKIMSRADYTAYHKTYDLIAQYCKTPQNINIPPLKSVPDVDDPKFQLEVMGMDTRDLEIADIAPQDSQTLGMDKRVCYEIRAEGKESLTELLKENFCHPDNNDFQLGNAVVRIVNDNKGLRLMDNLGAETGGMIMVDGSVEVGTFRKAASADNAPLVIMSEKGFIRVKNNGKHPTLAYLIALDKNRGEIQTSDNRSPLNLIGGIAANKLDPEQIKAGGYLYYNQSLDPTADLFGRYLGVVIGPAGGAQ